MVSAFAGPVQLAQRVAQGFDFPFVGVLLPFRKLQRFKNFLHAVERLLKR